VLRSNHDLKRQQQVQQQYKNQIHTDKAVKSILLISPEDDVNLALKTALEQVEGDATSTSSGYNFKGDCFNNPLLALKNFKSGLYDLLIVDVIMPQINGFDLAEEIKKRDQNIRVCFLIAGEVPGKPTNQFRVQTEGGYEYKFIKIPIDNNDLIRHVSVVMDS
jgi:two-component system, OmpR family, response regulator ChvI